VHGPFEHNTDNYKNIPTFESGKAMKIQTVISVLSGILFISAAVVAQSKPDETWTKQKVRTWFESKTWLGGLNLAPHTSVSQGEFAEQYRLHQSWWDSAFAFLKNQNLETIEKGKHPIDGDNVFATVTEDSTKDFEKTRWESHRKYADIQYVIKGEEKIGVRPVSGATVTQAYDEKTDVAHYSGSGKLFVARPGTFFIFFPPQAHRPNITTGGNHPDKKIVIKVRVTGYEQQ